MNLCQEATVRLHDVINDGGAGLTRVRWELVQQIPFDQSNFDYINDVLLRSFNDIKDSYFIVIPQKSLVEFTKYMFQVELTNSQNLKSTKKFTLGTNTYRGIVINFQDYEQKSFYAWEQIQIIAEVNQISCESDAVQEFSIDSLAVRWMLVEGDAQNLLKE